MVARPKEKNIILFVDVPTAVALTTLEKVKKAKRGKFKFMLLYSSKKWKGRENKEVFEKFDIVDSCNFNSPNSIIEAVSPYRDQLMCIYARAESQVENFQKVIPHVPYLRTPTTESLEWSINKYKMRRRFSAYDKKITPKFMIVKDQSKATIKEIEKKIGFPLIMKPTGLAQSILVSQVYHKEELESTLKNSFKKLNKVWKDSLGRGEPSIVVEQFIEGHMYSIDGYVNSRGKIYFCPLVAVKTGKEIGFDDFFGYQQMTPTQLTKTTVSNAEDVATKGVNALGLRSTAFHAELIKEDRGFKIVEIGPRIGGFRHDLYELSYGINHRANAVFITIPKKPEIPKRLKGHSAALKVFAKKEGEIKGITGIKKIQDLASLQNLSINKRIGDRARFAKNGGKSVFNVLMFNKDRSKLLADIRRMEKLIKIEIK
jgi:biotin carboxylase